MQPTTSTQTANSNLPTVDTFITRLIQEKELVITEPEIMAQIKQDLTDRLEDKINATILLHMPEEKLEEFNRILDTGTNDEAVAFASAVIPNINEKIASAMLQFRTAYLG